MIPDLDEAVTAIGAASRLAMACHIGPDGDALGSMLGMAVAAVENGKEVFPSFGHPFTLPGTFDFLPTDMLVAPDKVPAEPEVMVTFDAGSADRLGDLRGPAERAGTLVVIDHHKTNDGFGHHNLIVADAAATAEIVIELLDALGWKIGPQTATALHVGLVTDTGRFQYANTTPKTLRAAARMVEAGARPEVIGQHVYEETPFGYLHAAGAVLSRAVLEADRRLVWSVLTVKDLNNSGIGLDDTDPLIDALRTAQESDVAVLLKDLGGGRIKGSMRSRGRVDVGAIAVSLGGGGHHNAAGFTASGSVDGVLSAIRDQLEPVDV
jgi:phosphoesterase RecJ-like protein